MIAGPHSASTKRHQHRAGVAQLVEHQLPKLRVAGSRPVSRSITSVKRSIYLILALWAAFALSGCEKFWQGFQRGFVQNAQSNSRFHESFRKSFKESFLKSCEGGSPSARRATFCKCTDLELENKFDDAGLTAISTDAASAQQRTQLQKITQACLVKAGP